MLLPTARSLFSLLLLNGASLRGASNIGYHCKERVVQLPALRLVHVNPSIQLAAHRALRNRGDGSRLHFR
jgi:hypothetical protein